MFLISRSSVEVLIIGDLRIVAGIQVFNAQRVREKYPDLPVLYTTGYTRNAILHQGRLDPRRASFE
jgi:hypothetical protein